MGEVEAAYRGCRVHGIGFRKGDAGCRFGVQQGEEFSFLRMVGAGRITRSRADSPIFFIEQLLAAENFCGRIAPELTPHLFVQHFGKGFRKPVGQRLSQDAVVVVLLQGEPVERFFDAESCSDGESSDIIPYAALFRGDEIRQGKIWFALRFFLLLAQGVHLHEGR